MKMKILTLGVMTSLLAFSTASAEEITYRYTAVQSVVGQDIIPGTDAAAAVPFTEISGTFTYETDAIASNGNTAEIGIFETGDIVIDQFNYVTTYETKDTVVYDNVSTPDDGFNIFLQTDSNGLRDSISLQLEDREGTVFSGSNLPTELPLEEFEKRILLLFHYNFATEISGVVIYDIASWERVPDDSDGDGVNDDIDICPNTDIPESAPTSGKLGNARYALTDAETTTFEGGKSTSTVYTTEDTSGCSCEQIVTIQGLGKGQLKGGCSISTLEDWTSPPR